MGYSGKAEARFTNIEFMSQQSHLVSCVLLEKIPKHAETQASYLESEDIAFWPSEFCE